MLFTCLIIFLARIVDVTIATFRTMIMVKRKSFILPILAFLEVFIWFIAARRALNTNFDSILIPISYAAGYATGTYLGCMLSSRLVKDVNTIEVTTVRNNYKLIDKLRDKGLGVSVIGLKDEYGVKKDLLIIDVKSRLTKEITKFIKDIDDNAFIVIRDTKLVYNGYIK